MADAATQPAAGKFVRSLSPWLGARELLRHGRNPYSAEITREIQQGYYGRPIDPRLTALSNDPKDQQAFAYPVTSCFCWHPR